MPGTKKGEAVFYGPKFVEWMESEGYCTIYGGSGRFRETGLGARLGPALFRRYTGWRSGEDAQLKSVDLVCLKLNLDLNMIPDEVYKVNPGS